MKKLVKIRKKIMWCGKIDYIRTIMPFCYNNMIIYQIFFYVKVMVPNNIRIQKFMINLKSIADTFISGDF